MLRTRYRVESSSATCVRIATQTCESISIWDRSNHRKQPRGRRGDPRPMTCQSEELAVPLSLCRLQINFSDVCAQNFQYPNVPFRPGFNLARRPHLFERKQWDRGTEIPDHQWIVRRFRYRVDTSSATCVRIATQTCDTISIWHRGNHRKQPRGWRGDPRPMTCQSEELTIPLSLCLLQINFSDVFAQTGLSECAPQARPRSRTTTAFI